MSSENVILNMEMSQSNRLQAAPIDPTAENCASSDKLNEITVEAIITVQQHKDATIPQNATQN